MESSPYTAVTLDIFETMWQQGYRNAGVVLQSYLHAQRATTCERMNELGARVRLVKGAYKEPRSVAYQTKADVDAAFVALMKLLLAEGTYPAIATHDPAMIEATQGIRGQPGIGGDRFEFQMLYGIRRDLQAALTARATGCASTFRSAASGSRTSCDDSANGPPTSASCCGVCSASAESLAATRHPVEADCMKPQ